MSAAEATTVYSKKPLWLIFEEYIAFLVVVVPLLLLIHVLGGFGISEIVNELSSFLKGDPSAITSSTNIAGALTLGLIIAFILSVLNDFVAVCFVWAEKSKALEQIVLHDALLKVTVINLPTILFEEIFARWFFLGFLGNYFDSVTSLYVLLFMGLTLWTALHLANYKMNIGVVYKIAVIFAMGIMFGFMYLKFGFWITFAAHYSNNYLAIAVVRLQRKFGHKYTR